MDASKCQEIFDRVKALQQDGNGVLVYADVDLLTVCLSVFEGVEGVSVGMPDTSSTCTLPPLQTQ